MGGEADSVDCGGGRVGIADGGSWAWVEAWIAPWRGVNQTPSPRNSFVTDPKHAGHNTGASWSTYQGEHRERAESDRPHPEGAMQAAFGTRFPHQLGQTRRVTVGQRAFRVRTGLVRAATEVAIIIAGVLAYFLVRGLMDGQEANAIGNADALIRFERGIGVFVEPQVQDWALGMPALGTVANWIYIWGHWPVIVATLVWLLIKHPREYALYRNALLISGCVGLIIFTLYPMAPPRFMPEWGFLDTVSLHSQAYRVLQPPSMVNQYAAMPSLHCGWDLLMGIAIARHAAGRIRWIGRLLPVLMVAAVVLTANHYFMDAVVGDLLVIASLAVAASLRRGVSRPRVAARQRSQALQGA